MTTGIKFLELLEQDLHEAAVAEWERAEERRTRAADRRPHRLPRRGRSWGKVAAALAVFVVVAGGIGLLAQGGFGSKSNSGTAAPAQVNPRPGFDGGYNWGLTHDTAGAGDRPSNEPQADLSKIVRNGQIGIQVANGQFTTSVQQVTRIAVTNAGMVLSSTSQNDQSGTFTLRIPAARFDRAMSQLRAMAPTGGVMYQDATGKDVTAQFIDYRARLSILRRQRALLLGLQAKATGASEILSYADRINTVQLQIEEMQGQLNVLNDSVAVSTVKVELREKDAASPTASDVRRPSLASAWDFAVQGFLRILAAVVVGLGYLIPLAAIAAVAWGVLTLVRRRRRVAS
jgi:hypothetical protein